MRPQLATIPAGPFLMGSSEGQPDEQPVRTVWVDAFALGVHAVTNDDYSRFLQHTGHRRTAVCEDPRFRLPEQPVVAVSWFDAVAYCAWLSEVTGRTCRLPSEAEREKAARGGAIGWRYPWGDDLAAGPVAADAGCLPRVARDRPNGYGLHDMGDLVHEWCSDWYAGDSYRVAPDHNPRGPATGTRRVSRGGSWRHQIPFTRCAARSSLPPDRTYTDYGFRVAVSL